MGARPTVTSLNRDLRSALAVEAVTAKASGTVHTANHNHQENIMTQKIIEVVGTSKESFAKAAENAVAEAAKTVRACSGHE